MGGNANVARAKICAGDPDADGSRSGSAAHSMHWRSIRTIRSPRSTRRRRPASTGMPFIKELNAALGKDRPFLERMLQADGCYLVVRGRLWRATNAGGPR